MYNWQIQLLSDDLTALCAKVTLMRVQFSPVAVYIDQLACGFNNNCPVLRSLLRGAARMASLMTKHVVVNLTIEGESLLSEEPDDLLQNVISTHKWMLKGHSITTHCNSSLPLAILLLWNFNNCRNFTEVYTSLKRAMPDSHLSIDQAMKIPMVFARYRETTYLPPPDLLTIHSSVITKRHN
jgi:hypothetical protein